MLTTLLTVLWLGQITPPAPRGENLPFDVARLSAQAQITIRITDAGRPTEFRGVPLARLLPPRSAGATEMGWIKSLSDAVIVVRCADGYQVAYSAAAVAMDPGGTRYLLALARDGEPLDGSQGPIQMVVPGDTMKVRWCRQVVSARLVRVGSMDATP